MAERVWHAREWTQIKTIFHSCFRRKSAIMYNVVIVYLENMLIVLRNKKKKRSFNCLKRINQKCTNQFLGLCQKWISQRYFPGILIGLCILNKNKCTVWLSMWKPWKSQLYFSVSQKTYTIFCTNINFKPWTSSFLNCYL